MDLGVSQNRTRDRALRSPSSSATTSAKRPPAPPLAVSISMASDPSLMLASFRMEGSSSTIRTFFMQTKLPRKDAETNTENSLGNAREFAPIRE